MLLKRSNFNFLNIDMKKLPLILFVATLILSCAKPVSNEDIPKLNGYWEIEKVDFPEGEDKEYSMNETFDYFQIKDNKGFRFKVAPQLDGTFLTNGDSEKIEIKETNGAFYIYYVTPFSKWKEKIISISDEELVIENDSKKEYHYKKAAPINIIPDGKETK